METGALRENANLCLEIALFNVTVIIVSVRFAKNCNTIWLG